MQGGNARSWKSSVLARTLIDGGHQSGGDQSGSHVRLPNADRAIVDRRKVRDYLLSRSHPIGRFKAAFLACAGFEAGNWADLVSQLRELAVLGDALPGEPSEHGEKYMISGILKGPQGISLAVTTVWLVPTSGDAPRLVTVYPR